MILDFVNNVSVVISEDSIYWIHVSFLINKKDRIGLTGRNEQGNRRH